MVLVLPPDHTERVPLPDGPSRDPEDSDPAHQVLSRVSGSFHPVLVIQNAVLAPLPGGLPHCKVNLGASGALRSQLISVSRQALGSSHFPTTEP